MRRKITLVVSIILFGGIAVCLSVYAGKFIKQRIKAGKVVDAIDRRDYEKLTRLLELNPQMVDGRIMRYSQPFLNYCIERGDIEGARIFLSRGADPNLRGFSSRRALHLAVTANSRDMVLLLLENGADVEAPGYRHQDKPLHLCASRGFDEMVTLLLDHGARVDSRNMQKETPLMYAVQHEMISTARLLIQKGARKDLVDQNGHDVLWMAEKTGNQKLVDFISAPAHRP